VFNFAYYPPAKFEDVNAKPSTSGDFIEIIGRFKELDDKVDKVKVGDVFTKGQRVIATIIKGENGYPAIDKKSLKPTGTRSTTEAAETVEGKGTTDADVLYDAMKIKREYLNGRNKGFMGTQGLNELREQGLLPGMDQKRAFNAWILVRDNYKCIDEKGNISLP
jgi:hypothetical protein